MSVAHKLELVSVEDYLAGELSSTVKHEYVAGVVYAMAGARNVHNLIASNALIAIGSQLRGRVCSAYNSDTKIRIRAPLVRFYYADVAVICQSNPPEDSFQDKPVVLVEVISESTRRVDEGEKRDAYLSIPTLQAYLLVEQSSPAVVVFRRTVDGFSREVLQGADSVVWLPSIDVALSLGELYEGVKHTNSEGTPAPDGIS